MKQLVSRVSVFRSAYGFLQQLVTDAGHGLTIGVDMNDIDAQENMVQRLRGQDAQALADLFSVSRDRLWRMVNFRLDRRLRSRLWAGLGVGPSRD